MTAIDCSRISLHCTQFGWIQHVSPAATDVWRYDNGTLPMIATPGRQGARSDPTKAFQPVTPPANPQDWDDNPWYGGDPPIPNPPADFAEHPTPQPKIGDLSTATNVKFITQLVCATSGEVLFSWRWGPLDHKPGTCSIGRNRVRAPFSMAMLRPVCRHAFLFAALMPLAHPAGPAVAGEPPKELFGKSVVVTWNEERLQRREDQRDFRNVTIRGEYLVYVSSEGRLFNRVTMENPRGQKGGKDRVGNTERRFTDFDGDKMIATQRMAVGGARQIVVTFAAGHAGCNAQVIRGVEEGRESMVADSLIRSGIKVEIKSVKTGAVTCQVRDRNVFGGE